MESCIIIVHSVYGQLDRFRLIFKNVRSTKSAQKMSCSHGSGVKKFIYLFYVASNINQSILNEACVTAGSSARVSEQRKHAFNDVKCSELGWSCIPLAVETYGCWKAEARLHLSRLASRLAARLNCS